MQLLCCTYSAVADLAPVLAPHAPGTQHVLCDGQPLGLQGGAAHRVRHDGDLRGAGWSQGAEVVSPTSRSRSLVARLLPPSSVTPQPVVG